MSTLSEGLGIGELDKYDKDFKPKSSPEVLKGFMEGCVYKDFLGEIDTRIEDLRDFLEVSDSKKYFAAQGAVAFARLVRGIFENLLENRLSDLEEESINRMEEGNG